MRSGILQSVPVNSPADTCDQRERPTVRVRHDFYSYAPCSCGSDVLTAAHMVAAEIDPVCAERVADVELLLEMLHRGEHRWAGPSGDSADPGDGRVA